MRATAGAVGIDVGSVTIKFACAGPGARDLVSWGIISRLSPGAEFTCDEAQRLRQVLLRRGIDSGGVVLGAPPGMATSAVLELPPRASGAPIEELARVEMARIMRCDPGSIESVSWDVPLGGKGTAGTTVMGIACPTARASALSEVFSGAGMRVIAIEPECVAIARACARWGGAASYVVVDLGAASGRVSVVVGGRVAMERNLGELGLSERMTRTSGEIRVGADAIRRLARIGPGAERFAGWRAGREAMDDMARELAEDTVRAIRESVAYVHGRATGVPVEQVLLCGWGSEVDGVCERIGGELGIHTGPIRPGTSVAGAGADGVFALAGGLATRACEEGCT